MCVQSLQSCLTLCNPMDCSPQDSSVHGILQARILEWVAISLSTYSLLIQFSSVSQSCPTLCDPINRSTPGLPVHHQLPEFTQTHVHQVGDAIQPSHPLSPPSPPAPNLSQHQGLFQWVTSSLYMVTNISLSPHIFSNHISMAVYHFNIKSFDFNYDIITLRLDVMVIMFLCTSYIWTYTI